MKKNNNTKTIQFSISYTTVIVKIANKCWGADDIQDTCKSLTTAQLTHPIRMNQKGNEVWEEEDQVGPVELLDWMRLFPP